MRDPKVLVQLYKFREGYPDSIVESQVTSAKTFLDSLAIDYDMTPYIVYDADADRVVDSYNPAIYDMVILLIPTWLEPTLAVRAIKPFSKKPVIVWGFGTFMHQSWRVNMGAMPGSGVVKGALREMGIDSTYIYGMPDDPDRSGVFSENYDVHVRG